MNAALGIGQLTRLAATNSRRAALAHAYAERLADIPEVLPLITPDHPMRHAWHLYVIRLDTDRAGITREAFMAGLAARGIGTGLHFRAVHEQRFYRETMRCGRRPACEHHLELRTAVLAASLSGHARDRCRSGGRRDRVGASPERAMTAWRLSVVVPVLDEEANLPELIRRCLAVFDALDYRCELILVDDGSRDASPRLIRDAARPASRTGSRRHPQPQLRPACRGNRRAGGSAG